MQLSLSMIFPIFRAVTQLLLRISSEFFSDNVSINWKKCSVQRVLQAPCRKWMTSSCVNVSTEHIFVFVYLNDACTPYKQNLSSLETRHNFTRKNDNIVGEHKRHFKTKSRASCFESFQKSRIPLRVSRLWKILHFEFYSQAACFELPRKPAISLWVSRLSKSLHETRKFRRSCFALPRKRGIPLRVSKLS